MAGLFPTNGVPIGQAADNTITNICCVATGCDVLWYSKSCGVRFDPNWGNAVTSELINAVTCMGLTYDCNKLTNLCEALQTRSPVMCALTLNTTPALTDSLAGCFDGVAGRSTIQRIYDRTFCALELDTTPALTDSVIGCFDGVAKRATIASLLALLASDSLCDLPVVTPVATDTVAGCFNGVQGRASITDLCSLCSTDPTTTIIPPPLEVGTIVQGGLARTEQNNQTGIPSVVLGDTVVLGVANGAGAVPVLWTYQGGEQVTTGTWRAHSTYLSSGTVGANPTFDANVWVRIA